MTREQAVKLAKTNWWKDIRCDLIVGFQLFESRLCMDFGDFQLATEKAIARPVWTHEFGPGVDGIKQEFLAKYPARTLP